MFVFVITTITDDADPDNDFDDNDNGQDKQVFEEDLADMEARDEAAAADQDAEGIQTDLETEAGESNEHPITVDGMNICEIAEKIDWGLNVDKQLSKLSRVKKDVILAKIEGEGYKPEANKRRTNKKMREAIFGYVKKECYCVAFHRSK